ncbi:nuclear transport factor 2 family protein [Vibrio ostreicida]|uniref:Nuclear transport factor 2 family protein n=1 Tax=Vibrio ostreicida TaxID=526588 RepID=A0ABT8BSN3_9VIBR|nr:nuclear transport factor 2 family protein [Vibrio ostreicida]MDN3609673.1 nuclear transport factor 2 family protein [Vibrio ostreicida]MDN3610995.1 nuclear transport factor 2 family protein [Vibrio ostreicida]NPD09495.1 nuclear transport factor 2 family protein [Vibrio ostreicida]
MDVESVGHIYQQLNKNNLHLLHDVYHNDVIFEDGAHRLEGWSSLKAYFDTLYTNVNRCQFDIKEHQQLGEVGFLTWVMTLEHPKLQSGQAITVNGVSHLKFAQGRVVYHRDYFDLGEMLYENLPLLGTVIKSIKKRLGQ